MSLKTWWTDAIRRGEEKNSKAAEAAREAKVRTIVRLEDLTDRELIAAAPAQSSLSFPHHQMEMQRRLKDAIEAQTAESRKSRIWSAWGTAVLAVLTVVLVILTVVLIRHG